MASRLPLSPLLLAPARAPDRRDGQDLPQRVAVIGAGTMGSSIALVFALASSSRPTLARMIFCSWVIIRFLSLDHRPGAPRPVVRNPPVIADMSD